LPENRQKEKFAFQQRKIPGLKHMLPHDGIAFSQWKSLLLLLNEFLLIFSDDVQQEKKLIFHL